MESTIPQFQIILGSSSIARRAIMAEMGCDFTIMTADIDEKSIRTEKPEELVMALAEAKTTNTYFRLQTADALISKIQASDTRDPDDKPTLLITADTVVVYGGMVREKPTSEEEARHFIKGYSGGYAETVTSVVVVNLKTGVRKEEWDKVEICFNEISDQTIDSLIEEGKVLSVAGALIIEHPLILPSIKKVVGSTDSVMGLPKALTKRLINDALL